MKPVLKYLIAPDGWSCTDKNPFSSDGSYGPTWSAFCLLDNRDDQCMTSQSGEGPFSARFGSGVKNLETHLADFLRYENGHGRTVILSFPPNIDVNTYVTNTLSVTPDSRLVRPDDPLVIVHSTTVQAWEGIRSSGELKAASQLPQKRYLPQEIRKRNPVEEYLSNEPTEYVDYIMFGEMDSYGPEIVVASYQTGEFIMDVNTEYQPGIRLYLDNHRIIRDGLGTRDGLHVMKVQKHLPLQPYLIAAIGLGEIDLPGQVTTWTLKSFVEKSNDYFRMKLSSEE